MARRCVGSVSTPCEFLPTSDPSTGAKEQAKPRAIREPTLRIECRRAPPPPAGASRAPRFTNFRDSVKPLTDSRSEKGAPTRRKAASSLLPNAGKVDRALREADAWRSVGEGWQPLFGSFTHVGYSFEWHDFTSPGPVDWGRSFHPAGIEVCLNLEGLGTIQGAETTVVVGPRTSAFYYQGSPPLIAERKPGMRHRFVTLEFAVGFLRDLFGDQTEHLHPLVRRVVMDGDAGSQLAPAEPAGAAVLQMAASLRHCPVFAPARAMWFQSKALEVASRFFFRPAGGDLFCTRTQRLGRERVERVRAILWERMAETPTLEELGRMVGCSPFYLSRLFSENTGSTIPQYLRQIRLERASELLRMGRCNVTEAALEVGYTSLSHFSTAFREMFGCCPGLYPLKIAAQDKLVGARSPAGSKSPASPPREHPVDPARDQASRSSRS